MTRTMLLRSSVTMLNVTEPLRYRDGHEGDVDPVVIDRGTDGSMRILVNYPPAARLKARNRFLFATSAEIAFILTGEWAARSRNMFFASVGSFWFIGAVAVIVFGIVWLQANSTCIFEISSKDLSFERRGRLSSRRRSFPRKSVRDIQTAKGRGGRAVALIIRTPEQKLAGRYFEYLDEQCIQQIAAALREGLGLMTVEAI